MLIESGSRIDNVQLELNIIEIYFWMRNSLIKFLDGEKKIFYQKEIYKKFEVNKNYFKNLKQHISKIFSKFNFFHPTLFINKPWVLYWLINSLDLIYSHFKKSNLLKNINLNYLFLSGSTISYMFKNSICSLFKLYSYSLYLSLIAHKNLKIIDEKSVKFIYYFLRSLLRISILPRSSKVSDCDGRNLFCILTISSLFGILTPNLENICIKKLRHVSTMVEGFSVKTFGNAHGALTYCWLGSFIFLNNKKRNINHLLRIKNLLTSRQNHLMFGFSGRMGKVPDSCYNFWVGASLILLNLKLSRTLENSLIFYYDTKLNSFSDRCGKPTDSYHICYSLCGLAMLKFLILSKKNIEMVDLRSLKKFYSSNNLSKLNPLYGTREYRAVQFLELFN